MSVPVILLLIIGGTAVLTGLSGLLFGSEAAAKVFIVCCIGSIFVGFIASVASINREEDATRDALEDRYGIDFTTGEFDTDVVTFVKDGNLYKCDVSGTGKGARLFCDEPPRDEFTD